MNEKTKGVIAYIFSWLGGLIILFGMKDNQKNTKMHAAQAIVIGVGYFLISIVYSFSPIIIPFFSTIMMGLYLVLIILGIVKVCKEENPELPVIGNIAKSLFSKKIEE